VSACPERFPQRVLLPQDPRTIRLLLPTPPKSPKRANLRASHTYSPNPRNPFLSHTYENWWGRGVSPAAARGGTKYVQNIVLYGTDFCLMSLVLRHLLSVVQKIQGERGYLVVIPTYTLCRQAAHQWPASEGGPYKGGAGNADLLIGVVVAGLTALLWQEMAQGSRTCPALQADLKFGHYTSRGGTPTDRLGRRALQRRGWERRSPDRRGCGGLIALLWREQAQGSRTCPALRADLKFGHYIRRGGTNGPPPFATQGRRKGVPY
jgi:hypothetical protein